MKLRDRQDKVERMLTFYGSSKGSPFHEASTLVRGQVDLLGALLLTDNVDLQDRDLLGQEGIRTGIHSRFTFEATFREKDTLAVEFVSSQNHKNNVDHLSGSPLSLAKVFYMANATDWLSAFAIPMGAQCWDVATVTNPSHQEKGLTDVSSSGPPLLNQYNGSAIGLMVKKSNVVASLAQFVSELEIRQSSDRVGHCFSTFGQIVCQLPKGINLSLLGLLQVPKFSYKRGNHGALTFSFGGFKHENAPGISIGTFGPPVGTNSLENVSTGSIALMLDSEIDEIPKIGGWIEMNNSNPKYLQFAVTMSDDFEDSLGWGMRFSGMIERLSNCDHFRFDSYLKLKFGKRFIIKPGITCIKDGNAKTAAFMLRSNWSL
nr:uncharacterized protein LOC125418133 isoform X2 [Ziziphus jujuba var. spinosa]XP_048332451.1 uncharacterized protein LOC125418133 isoform X2 [Ziziphus jujuba var. spinosa]XP_048332453.1 uncharacterized protein LOC125418133 isoform X2 [Ziziphus jujuba var. spinosa]